MIKVDLIDHMGTDLTVVNAARVSFDKESYWSSSDGGFDYILTEKDDKLIHFLAKHEHWSPFAHTSLQFRIKAPIFVARQLGKHQVGLVWNEVSRRYVDSEPEFYAPETWRKRAENKKQGSSEEAVSIPLTEYWGVGYDMVHDFNIDAMSVYERLLKAGVCPEQARMVLPQSMMTEWYWTGSLMAFVRVLKLRLDPHTQYETRIVAEKMAPLIEELFPVSYKALMEASV
jgi:thymidylate synthase (FAD)